MRARSQLPSFIVAAAHRSSLPTAKLVIALLSTLVLVLLWAPVVVRAQEASDVNVTAAESLEQSRDSAGTHLVRAGETLWGIAARYYGDGHLWTTLARRNQISISGPAPLRVGMKLMVPSGQTVRRTKAAAMAAAPADSSVPAVALAKAGDGALAVPMATRKAESLAAQTAAKSDASARGRAAGQSAKATGVALADSTRRAEFAPDSSRVDLQPQHSSDPVVAKRGTRIGLVNAGDQETSRKPSEVLTVFHRDLPDAAEAERRTRAVLRPNTPVPRQAEFESAPFVIGRESLAAGGLITMRVGSPSTAASGYPQRAIKTDIVEIREPTAQRYTVGQRLMAVTTVTSLDKTTVIAMPSGVLEVMSAEPGKPSLARLTRQSGRVEQGQRLLPAVGVTAAWAAAVPMSRADIASSVRWIDPSEVQPTLSSFVVLGAGTEQGVTAGDEFGIYRSGTKEHPEVDAMVARARIVRSDAGGSAAIIIKQYETDIRVGLTARRIGRAP